MLKTSYYKLSDKIKQILEWVDECDDPLKEYTMVLPLDTFENYTFQFGADVIIVEYEDLYFIINLEWLDMSEKEFLEDFKTCLREREEMIKYMNKL